LGYHHCVERAADLVVAALRQKLVSLEKQLESDTSEWPEGILVVEFQGDGARVRSGHVAYLPAVPNPSDTASGVFDEGERREFAERSPTSAATWYRPSDESAAVPARGTDRAVTDPPSIPDGPK